MKIYAIATLTSDWLCETIFLPSIYRTEPNAEVTLKKYLIQRNENYASPAYVVTLLHRLKNILIWIEENMGDFILISDVDIFYIRPFLAAMREEADGHDITGQRQRHPPSGELNFGQTIIRCSPATLSLFKSIYEECKRDHSLDQDVLNKQLETSGLKYKMLSTLFSNTSFGYVENMYSYHTIYSIPTPDKNSIQHKLDQFNDLDRYLKSRGLSSWK